MPNFFKNLPKKTKFAQSPSPAFESQWPNGNSATKQSPNWQFWKSRPDGRMAFDHLSDFIQN